MHDYTDFTEVKTDFSADKCRNYLRKLTIMTNIGSEKWVRKMNMIFTENDP